MTDFLTELDRWWPVLGVIATLFYGWGIYHLSRRFVTKEEYAELHKAIRQLTPRQQEVVKMIYFEGKTQEDVRKRFGIAKSSMSEVIDRIHASLKKILEKT